MGCAQSSNGAAAGGAPTSKGGSRTQDMRLLEEYSVGQTLGEGAFGVVSNCKKRSTGEEFAVKMVDKVETPVDAIRKEADMLQSMDHPNIVKFHGVYYERCFVCIVMDKYKGGDLVEGLQRHLKERGQIPCQNVVHVSKQMAASIDYLHKRKVVHRDVKGDNYLMDRKDMTSVDCKIVLTDFGTACNIEPEQRLSASVGTKIFWSPEFFDRNYGSKVDVWAMGVIMYGLVSGRFPFRDETDIRTKEVKIPKRVHATCEDFIKRMLVKKEGNRMTAKDVMEHDWLGSRGKSATQGPDDPADDPADTNTILREDAANVGIQERRQELINRLNKEHDATSTTKPSGPKKQARHFMEDKFALASKDGGQMVYEWWDKQQVKASKLLDRDGQSTPAKTEDTSDLKMFAQMLREHNIDANKFGVGQAKSLQGLASEVQSGAARLMLDATAHKKLVRVVDVVVLRVRSTDNNPRLLIEVMERFSDNRERETNRLPGTKKEPHENTRQTAERIISEFLRLDRACFKLDLANIDRHEEENESPSYPGVRTVYRKEIVEAKVATSDPAVLSRVGLPGFRKWEAKDKEGNTKFFEWMTPAKAETKKVKLRSSGRETISTLVRAPIGLGEDALKEQLTQQGIDVGKFGKDNTRTLKEFSAELIKGEATLMQDGAGALSRVVDIVVLIIAKGAGEILVQTEQVFADGKSQKLDRLPGAKRRPDENHFLSARRILRRQLEIDENQVELDTSVTNLEEEKNSTSYPGLKTMYRKRLIEGRILEYPK